MWCVRCADPANEDRRNINGATRPLLWQLAQLTQVGSTIGLSCYMFTFSLFVSHTYTHTHTHTHTGPCTQDKSDRQRLRAELRLLPFHSGFHWAEIIHCVQVDPAIRELTRQAGSERVRLCETDRQTDRASFCILTAPALGQPVHVSEGPLNNELSLPRRRHWLLSPSHPLSISSASVSYALFLPLYPPPPPTHTPPPPVSHRQQLIITTLSTPRLSPLQDVLLLLLLLPNCPDSSGDCWDGNPGVWTDAGRDSPVYMWSKHVSIMRSRAHSQTSGV